MFYLEVGGLVVKSHLMTDVGEGDKLGVEVGVRIRLPNLGASFGGSLGLGKR